MSETREQFRYRISQVAWAKSWSPENPQRADVASKHAVPDMAEAVYAQALRDVIEAFGGAFTASNWRTDEVYLDDAIKHFATERGIDLEDTR